MRTPVTASPMRNSRAASRMWIMATPLSYSCIPTSKMPTTVKRRRRGMLPAMVTVICGTTRVTFEPTSTASACASSRPRMMP